jgi:outer membrane protein assembly factor BamB
MAVIVVSVLSSVVLTGTASPRERTRGYQRPGVVAGFDVTTGQERWRNVIGDEDGASVDVSAVGGVMVVQRTRCLSADRDYRSGDTRLVGFDARTGDRLWSHDDLKPSGTLLSLGSPSRSHVVPVENRDGTLFGMRVRDGTTVWEKKGREIAWQRRPNANGIVGTTDDTAFVANAGLPPLVDAARVARFEAWDLETGKVRWTRVLDPGTYPTAIATDGTDLFISTWQDPDPASPDVPGSVLQIEAADGTVTPVAAAFRVPRGLAYTALAVTPDTISISTPGNARPGPLGHLVTFDRHTGEVLWTRESTLRYAVDALLFAQDDSFRTTPLLALEATTGRELWQRPPHFTAAPMSPSAVALTEYFEPGASPNTLGESSALDEETGEVLWTASEQGLDYGGTTRGIAAYAGGCRIGSQR